MGPYPLFQLIVEGTGRRIKQDVSFGVEFVYCFLRRDKGGERGRGRVNYHIVGVLGGEFVALGGRLGCGDRAKEEDGD